MFKTHKKTDGYPMSVCFLLGKILSMYEDIFKENEKKC